MEGRIIDVAGGEEGRDTGLGVLIRLDPRDSVAVAVKQLVPGDLVAVPGEEPLPLRERIYPGHKVALRTHKVGELVFKYGRPIGVAKSVIEPGSLVHVHNLESTIHGEVDYGQPPEYYTPPPPLIGNRQSALGAETSPTFLGYRREDGSVGCRNQIWIIPTVGCVNSVAMSLSAWARAELGADVLALCHPYGCSQLGDDLAATRRILAALARNPNAAAVLVLSLGCENNGLGEFLAEIGPRPDGMLISLRIQDENDEVSAARAALVHLADYAARFKRETLPASELVLGVKCGGSDAFSGITANPLVGRVADLIVAAGGSVLLSEVPEMFGAEEEVLGRAASREVWEKTAAMLNHWKAFYLNHGQSSHENPSPGNRDGGITTIEEKSLGCVRKAGGSQVQDVLLYGGRRRRGGLSLVSGPGNDLISSTALAAAGAQVILFTTGRGTPFGSVVPTIKVSSKTELATSKAHWIDHDAGPLLAGANPSKLASELMSLVCGIASGESTKSERAGYHDIAIFKDGVTL